MKGTYHIYIDGYDWGCGVSKVVVTLDDVLDAVDKSDFDVTETKQVTDFSKVPEFPVTVVTVPRQITEAYLCDENGKCIERPSKHVALALRTSPNEGSPLLFSMKTQLNTWSQPYYLTVTQSKTAKLTSNGKAVESLVIEKEMTGKTTAADVFQTDVFASSDGLQYRYAYYEPEEATDVLVVWLHGLGEGGTQNTDAMVTVLANKVTALTQKPFQDIMGGAYILAPQCPTYWMDNDGQETNFCGGTIQSDGSSFYTQSLNELINDYKEKCGAKKVILTGCSNGGFMTMVMAIAYPNQYDAVVPICEALPDSMITDANIASIAHLPMFFIYSNDDNTVVPTQHEIPTIARLKAAGAKHIHVFAAEHVTDTSGQVKDADGKPYQYPGHWSWIYFDNNDACCDECHIKVWDWMAEHIKA